MRPRVVEAELCAPRGASYQDFIVIDDELGFYGVGDGHGSPGFTGRDVRLRLHAIDVVRGALHMRNNARGALDEEDLRAALADLDAALERDVAAAGDAYDTHQFSFSCALWPPFDERCFVATRGTCGALLVRGAASTTLARGPHHTSFDFRFDVVTPGDSAVILSSDGLRHVPLRRFVESARMAGAALRILGAVLDQHAAVVVVRQ